MSSKGNAALWETISIRVTGAGGADSYQVSMDRETASKLAQHITEYLKPKV